MADNYLYLLEYLYKFTIFIYIYFTVMSNNYNVEN